LLPFGTISLVFEAIALKLDRLMLTIEAVAAKSTLGGSGG
jgi:hypothetical protein